MAGALLALDQSLSATGWALLDPVAGGAVQSGSWPLCDGSRNRAEGFREIWRRLDELHKSVGLASIVYEEPPLGTVNKGADQIFGKIGIVAIVELFALSRGLSIASYYPQSWRATFFAKAERAALKGKDWKRPAIERCRQLGFDPVTHDEAEAIAILDHHLHKAKITPFWRNGRGLMLDPVA